MTTACLLIMVATILPEEPRPSETYAAQEYAAWTAKLTGAPALEIRRDDRLGEDGFHRAPDPRRMNRCPFDRDTLPATGGWRFAVYPRNAWGRAGSPVFSSMQIGR